MTKYKMAAVCLQNCRYISTQKRKTQVKKTSLISVIYQELLHRYRIFYFYQIRNAYNKTLSLYFIPLYVQFLRFLVNTSMTSRSC